MKKIIRLTESDLARIVKRVIKENEEEWISQSEDMEMDSDFEKIEVPREIADNPHFKKLVSILKRNPEEAEELEMELQGNLNEDYEYFDYSDAQPEKISRKDFWVRKIKNLLGSAAVGAVMGIFMAGGPDADTVIEMALAMAAGTAVVSNVLISTVGREKVKDEEESINEMEDEGFMIGADRNWKDREEDDDDDYSGLKDVHRKWYDQNMGKHKEKYIDDEEWGQTDMGEEELQDLIEEARDFLENECGYDLHDLNLMSEKDIVDALYDEGNDELAGDIEYLMDKEGFYNVDEDEPYDAIGGYSVNDIKRAFDNIKKGNKGEMEEELEEGWDDFTQKKRYPEDYKPEKYRRLPKGFLRKHSGRMIDPEGTILTKIPEDPFDEYEEFDDEDYA
jgi:hypothetical protein